MTTLSGAALVRFLTDLIDRREERAAGAWIQGVRGNDVSVQSVAFFCFKNNLALGRWTSISSRTRSES